MACCSERRLQERRTTFTACLALIAALMGATTLGGEQELTVSRAWIRFIMPSVPAAGYLRVSNASGTAHVLIGADSPACGTLSLHESLVENGVDRMVMLKRILVPAHGHVDFTPGSYHLMCMAPSKEMIPGHQIAITLLFADGEKITARFMVRSATGT